MGRRKGRNKSQDEEGVNLDSLIAMAVSTGKVKLGGRSATKESKGSKARAYIIAENCPVDIKKELEYNASMSSVPVIQYPKSSFELGPASGWPWPVTSS